MRLLMTRDDYAQRLSFVFELDEKDVLKLAAWKPANGPGPWLAVEGRPPSEVLKGLVLFAELLERRDGLSAIATD